MTDDLDQLLSVALCGRAQGAPTVAGFTDVRRRVRRRRHRHSALVVLPTLVGASALARWTSSDDAQSVVGGDSTVSETTNALAAPPALQQGFRCSDAGMLAGDVDAWLYFQGCEAWEIGNAAPTTTLASLEQEPTKWAGPSTAAVAFLNASSVDGVASSVGSRFGAGEPLSSPIKSANSFVMYGDLTDEPTASAVAEELGIPLRASVDPSYIEGEQSSATVFVVIGEDLAAQLSSAVTPNDLPPVQPISGVPTRCWDPSEVEGNDPAYRYFTTCEPTQSDDLENSGGTTPSTEPLATTVPTANGCTAGHATITTGDNPAMFATRYNISLDELDAANTDTPGYSIWSVGLVVIVPCPAAP